MNSHQGGQAAAGWYPDPADPHGAALRFWDGAGWTEHRSAAAAPARRASGGFPLLAIPALTALVALIVTTAYATVYSLLRWGDIGTVGSFFTSAAPSLLGGPFSDPYYSAHWFFDVRFGEVWVLAVPLLTVVVSSAVLAAFSRAGAGARLLAGALVAVPLAACTVALVLVTPQFADWSFYTDDLALSAAAGATIVGVLGGLLGALLSLALSPPRPSRAP